MPGVAIFSLIAYCFPKGMNRLLVLFEVDGSNAYAKPRNRVSRVTLDFLLGEL
jgi:hypothetical protein